jgi:uncharacterized membrane protein YphA (DoxX/SURF4 family)
MIDIVFLLGRILFSFTFIFSGLNHFYKYKNWVSYGKTKINNLFLVKFGVIYTAITLTCTGISVGFGIKPAIGSLWLFMFLFPMSFILHPFWRYSDSNKRLVEKMYFYKNMSLSGASLLMCILFLNASNLNLGYMIVL